LGFFQVTAYLDYTIVYNENSIHHFWDGDRDGDGGGGTCTKCRKTELQKSFTKDAKMMHREMTDICITVYILENQVNNMWDIKMIYRSK